MKPVSMFFKACAEPVRDSSQIYNNNTFNAVFKKFYARKIEEEVGTRQKYWIFWLILQ
jgi:hypothetical protein